MARNQDEDPRTFNWINDKAFPGNGGAKISAGPRMIDPLTADGGFSSKNEKQDRTCKVIQQARLFSQPAHTDLTVDLHTPAVSYGPLRRRLDNCATY